GRAWPRPFPSRARHRSRLSCSQPCPRCGGCGGERRSLKANPEAGMRHRRTSMKRVVVLLAVFLMLWAVILPGSAWARDGWHGGRHGGHGGWWWPGAVIGGLAFGVVAAVTAPIWMLSAATAYSPPVAYAPPAVDAAPPAYSWPST